MSKGCETLYTKPKASAARLVAEPWSEHKGVHILSLYRGLMVLEVWYDRDFKGFRISIQGAMKYYGKHTYATVDIAKLHVLAKAKVQLGRLRKQVELTLEAVNVD